MTAILATVSLVVTEVVSFIGTVATAVVAQPILLIPVALGLLGSGVALVKRFI